MYTEFKDQPMKKADDHLVWKDGFQKVFPSMGFIIRTGKGGAFFESWVPVGKNRDRLAYVALDFDCKDMQWPDVERWKYRFYQKCVAVMLKLIATDTNSIPDPESGKRYWDNLLS